MTVLPAMPELENGDDKLHEECAVFGIFGLRRCRALSPVLGLHALQHRGQEASGIVTYNNGQFVPERHVGLVGDIFGAKHAGRVETLKGDFAIGHNRYSTARAALRAANIQPMFVDLAGGGASRITAHATPATSRNVGKRILRAPAWCDEGAICQSTSDTEVIIHLAACSWFGPVVYRVIDRAEAGDRAPIRWWRWTSKKLIGARDPSGVRPLVAKASSTATPISQRRRPGALDIIGATFWARRGARAR